MFIRRSLLLAGFAFLPFLFCAVRDNPYDPVSSYHRSPSLFLDFTYDTTRVINKNDTVFILAPCRVSSIDAYSDDYFNDNSTLPVLFQHFHDGLLVEEIKKQDFTIQPFMLKETGLHLFKFTVQADNGSLSEKQVLFSVDADNKPTIKKFEVHCDTLGYCDTLPLEPPEDSRGNSYFIATIADTNHLLDSMIYIFPEFPEFWYIIHDSTYFSPYVTNKWDTIITIIKEEKDTVITEEKDTIITDKKDTTLTAQKSIIDTVPFNPSSFVLPKIGNAREYKVKAILVDKIGRRDSAYTFLYFSEDKKVVFGLPPYINDITIQDRDEDSLYAYDNIIFNVDASDQENDGRIISYNWDFGDGTQRRTGIDSSSTAYSYEQPGKYNVTVTVTDDSTNQVSRSENFTIKSYVSFIPKFETFIVQNDSGNAPLTISVSAKASVKNGFIRRMRFYFNDSTTSMSETTLPEVDNIEHTYVNPGIYVLRAVAIDNNGEIGDTTHTIIVKDPNKE